MVSIGTLQDLDSSGIYVGQTGRSLENCREYNHSTKEQQNTFIMK